MGAQPSRPKRIVRSVSFGGNQREIYREYDIELFKIDCDIRFSKSLNAEKISEVRQRLYCLHKNFDASKMKEKYDIEFRQKYRVVMENLEQRIQSSQQPARKGRKKRLAPSPPQPRGDLEEKIWKIQGEVAKFRGRRDGNLYNYLHETILSLLFKMPCIEDITDEEKYKLMKDLVTTLKQLEDNTVDNDEINV